MSYREDLEYLQYVYLRMRGRDNIKPLLIELGCKIFEAEGDSFSVRCPRAPHAVHDVIVTEAFQNLLRWYCESAMASDQGFVDVDECTGYSIASGLLENSRWRDCVSTPAGAHQLAALLIYLSDLTDRVMPESSLYLHSFKAAVMPVVAALANEWLQLDQSPPRCASTNQLTRIFFGNAWCDVVLQNALTAPKQICLERPPFMPDVPCLHAQVQMSLPPPEGP